MAAWARGVERDAQLALESQEDDDWKDREKGSEEDDLPRRDIARGLDKAGHCHEGCDGADLESNPDERIGVQLDWIQLIYPLPNVLPPRCAMARGHLDVGDSIGAIKRVQTAFKAAGAAPIVPASLLPLYPSRWLSRADGSRNGRRGSRRPAHGVVHEAGRQELFVLSVDRVFGQSPPIPCTTPPWT